jgi:predicted transcriptional regulator
MAAHVSVCRAKALRDYREKYGFVRAELGRWAGIDGGTLYRYETGRSPVPRYVFHLYRYYVRLKNKDKNRGREAIE